MNQPLQGTLNASVDSSEVNSLPSILSLVKRPDQVLKFSLMSREDEEVAMPVARQRMATPVRGISRRPAAPVQGSDNKGTHPVTKANCQCSDAKPASLNK